jgi:hypothetical protein
METFELFTKKVSSLQKQNDQQKQSLNKAYVTYSGMALNRIYRAALLLAKEEFDCGGSSSSNTLPTAISQP